MAMDDFVGRKSPFMSNNILILRTAEYGQQKIYSEFKQNIFSPQKCGFTEYRRDGQFCADKSCESCSLLCKAECYEPVLRSEINLALQ